MENNQLENLITIINDDGQEVQCELLFTYHAEDTNVDYAIFTPVLVDIDEDYDEPVDVYAYRYTMSEDGQGELFVIEDDDEYEMINEVIDQYFEDLAESEEE